MLSVPKKVTVPAGNIPSPPFIPPSYWIVNQGEALYPADESVKLILALFTLLFIISGVFSLNFRLLSLPHVSVGVKSSRVKLKLNNISIDLNKENLKLKQISKINL